MILLTYAAFQHTNGFARLFRALGDQSSGRGLPSSPTNGLPSTLIPANAGLLAERQKQPAQV